VLNVPAELSDTGKRRQLFFDTEKAAKADIENLKSRADNFGVSLTALTPAKIAEAAEGYKLLEPHGIGLLDAIRSYIKSHKELKASIPFLELFNLFLEAKKGRNPQYLRELRFTRDRWPKLHEKLASEINAPELEALLAGISPGARNPILRYWRAVFNYGIKRGYCVNNPVSKLDFEERVAKEVETLTNAQVETMLQHAASNDLALLPFLVLGLFSGIRPDGELQKLEWSDIDLNDKVVTIRPEVSKTKRRRFVDLSNNAKSWLQLFIKRAGIQQGPVVTYNYSELRTHRTANWTAAGVTAWPQQGMRHTYCSNWLAKHKDINKLVLQSGHDSVDTMWRHYHRGTAEAEAKKFWAIRPKKLNPGKIIEFQQPRAA
jgi:integrase